MTPDTLAARFEIAFKALSLSRGRLAVELGVDKSLVSRWLSGTNTPSSHNLAKITQFVAGHREGFCMLDWERPMAEFTALMGVRSPASGRKVPELPREFDLTDLIPPLVMEEARATTKFRGGAYEGFWRSTRLANDPAGAFMHDQIMIWRSDQGLLRTRMGVYDMRFEGWLLPVQSQLFGIACDPGTGVLLFSIFNAVFRNRAHLLDGLTLTLQRTQGGTPVAAASIMERIEDLTGNIVVDEARFRVLANQNPIALPDSIPKAIRDHIFKDIGPAAFAAGGPALLAMAFANSLSVGLGAEGPVESVAATPDAVHRIAGPVGLRLVVPER